METTNDEGPVASRASIAKATGKLAGLKPVCVNCPHPEKDHVVVQTGLIQGTTVYGCSHCKCQVSYLSDSNDVWPFSRV